MIVLGIDPGLANLGLGVVVEEGRRSRHLYHDCIVTPASLILPERLGRLYDAVSSTLRTHRPEAVSLEDQYLRKQADVAFKVGQAVGVIQLACAQAGVPVFTYGPMQVKQALVGAGRAEKAQVIYMVKATLGLRELSTSHAADALALALTHLASRRMPTALVR
ncbi:crossover junction endodeoxyribonuclease RuvC [Deinobacterium chartae]|uniref:Crossover junction endodeoxyribonuclease RuvC n=1 Tax=Deinobacterium chartae TaxID=521158 RepID=A0A841I2U4_9DEIO|nr:crossover junction endodeoxyribonuclease RuvC [Deinobacterium chartae]MBB6099334.1 crossover junction endodeoxyribonuclease RuvC [Deinobacterium chartae]